MATSVLLPSITALPLSQFDYNFFREHEAKNNIFNIMNIENPPENTHETAVLKGAWSPEEDQKLKNAISRCDPIIWDVVAESVPGRNAIQCKERWMYRLNPDIKKTRFEKWEDELIIKERRRVGNHWTLIANKLPGRTSCAVKNRWYSVLRNKVGFGDVIYQN